KRTAGNSFIAMPTRESLGRRRIRCCRPEGRATPLAASETGGATRKPIAGLDLCLANRRLLVELLQAAFRLGASVKLLGSGRLPWLPSKQTLDRLADLQVTRNLPSRPAPA